MCGFCQLSRRRFGKVVLGLSAAAAVQSSALGRAQAANKRPLIMIDPGHGGHDPGAIAPDGVFEKNITLASALTLREHLLETGRYRVRMTRETDVFVTLEGRVADAVAENADLFLAMHCDHLPTPNLRGASIFTLSGDASDGLAASLADAQNSADTFGTSNVSPQVAAILASLETRATRISSANFAEDIKAAFKGTVPLLPDPTRSANFAVLRDPSTPSNLLEMGCLTNPLDEKLLTSPAHRNLMAAKLTSAIGVYFRDYTAQRDANISGLPG